MRRALGPSSHRRSELGASAVEYGLLVAAIAAIIVLVVFALGLVTKGNFSETCSNIEGQVKTGTDCAV